MMLHSSRFIKDWSNLRTCRSLHSSSY
jgi:hypothetical protein